MAIQNPKLSPWKTQWNRILRYQNRLGEMQQQIPFDRSAAYFCDDLHAFFVECHSLKDWLYNDDGFLPALPRDEECKGRRPKYDDEHPRYVKIEDFVHSNYDLQLCADIANGKKHLELQAKRKTQVPELEAAVKPGLVLHLGVILHADGEEFEFSCSPDKFADKDNQEKLAEALRHSPSRHCDVLNEIRDNVFIEDDADWEEAAARADKLRVRLAKEFDSESIFLNVFADVQREGNLLDFEMYPDFFCSGVGALASNCIRVWSEFLDREAPGWND